MGERWAGTFGRIPGDDEAPWYERRVAQRSAGLWWAVRLVLVFVGVALLALAGDGARRNSPEFASCRSLLAAVSQGNEDGIVRAMTYVHDDLYRSAEVRALAGSYLMSTDQQVRSRALDGVRQACN